MFPQRDRCCSRCDSATDSRLAKYFVAVVDGLNKPGKKQSYLLDDGLLVHKLVGAGVDMGEDWKSVHQVIVVSSMCWP